MKACPRAEGGADGLSTVCRCVAGGGDISNMVRGREGETCEGGREAGIRGEQREVLTCDAMVERR